MFAPWCPTCRRRTLLGPRRLERLDRTPDGPVATVRCFCGTVLNWPEQRAPLTAQWSAPVSRNLSGSLAS